VPAQLDFANRRGMTAIRLASSTQMSRLFKYLLENLVQLPAHRYALYLADVGDVDKIYIRILLVFFEAKKRS